jgi:hypothetical protein
MTQEKRKHKWRKTITQFGGVVLLGFLGYQAGGFLARRSESIQFPDGLNILSAMTIALAAIYLVLLTHELGHLLAGKLAGMRPFLFITGPLKLTATKNSWSVGLNTSLALAGGLAACMPGKSDNLKNSLLIMVAGGPLASLLGSLLGLGLYFSLPATSLWSFFFFLFAITAAGIFFATMLPAKTSGFMTDGAQILSLLRDGADAEQRALLVVLQAESMSGVRPREYSHDLIERLLSTHGNPMIEASAQLIAYLRHLDRNEIEQAGRALNNALAYEADLPEGFRQAFYLEYAYFQAAHQADVATARAYLQKSHGAIVEKHSRLRAEAAVLFAEGQTTEARGKAAQALRLADHSYDSGSAAAEKEWLQRLIDQPA